MKKSYKEGKRAVHKAAPKKTKSRKKGERNLTNADDKFNFNEEIVIGITVPVKEKEDKKVKSKKHRNKKTEPKKIKKQVKDKTKYGQAKNPNNKIRKRIVKFVILVIVCISVGIFMLVSPQFNIKTINVIGNKHVTESEILNLANIEKGKNIFSFSRVKKILNIKQNAYIDSVTIKNKLPDTVEIYVEERTVCFNIKNEEKYVFLDEAGNVLEISNEASNSPIIIGLETNIDEVEVGQKIKEADLTKLSEISKINEAFKNNDIIADITEVDATNSDDYIVVIESEQKNIHIGDITDLGTKALYVKNIIEKEKGIRGDIFVNMDLNKKNAFFRESV